MGILSFVAVSSTFSVSSPQARSLSHLTLLTNSSLFSLCSVTASNSGLRVCALTRRSGSVRGSHRVGACQFDGAPGVYPVSFGRPPLRGSFQSRGFLAGTVSASGGDDVEEEGLDGGSRYETLAI